MVSHGKPTDAMNFGKLHHPNPIWNLSRNVLGIKSWSFLVKVYFFRYSAIMAGFYRLVMLIPQPSLAY